MAWGGWTEENIATLKEAYLEGLSGGQIAAKLGCTRNTVIGKLSRLKLTKTPARIAATQAMHGARGRMAQRREPKPEAGAPVVKISTGGQVYESLGPAEARPLRTVKVESLKLTLPALKAADCRYPTDESPDGEHLFCGKRKSPDGPYCKEHAVIAYQAPAPARKRNPGANTSNYDRLTSDLRSWRTA